MATARASRIRYGVCKRSAGSGSTRSTMSASSARSASRPITLAGAFGTASRA